MTRLDTLNFEAQRLAGPLLEKLADMSKGHVLGNLARNANAASDAWNACHELQKALSAVTVEAERVRCEREDARQVRAA